MPKQIALRQGLRVCLGIRVLYHRARQGEERRRELGIDFLVVSYLTIFEIEECLPIDKPPGCAERAGEIILFRRAVVCYGLEDELEELQREHGTRDEDMQKITADNEAMNEELEQRLEANEQSKLHH